MGMRFPQHVGFFSSLCYDSTYFWSDLVSSGICVTTALPYANGDLHLGHILEQIQADIWCRFLKLCGEKVLFAGGDDAHGTAIMLSAEKKGVTQSHGLKIFGSVIELILLTLAWIWMCFTPQDLPKTKLSLKGSTGSWRTMARL